MKSASWLSRTRYLPLMLGAVAVGAFLSMGYGYSTPEPSMFSQILDAVRYGFQDFSPTSPAVLATFIVVISGAGAALVLIAASSDTEAPAQILGAARVLSAVLVLYYTFKLQSDHLLDGNVTRLGVVIAVVGATASAIGVPALVGPTSSDDRGAQSGTLIGDD